jgi:hypothetical protein
MTLASEVVTWCEVSMEETTGVTIHRYRSRVRTNSSEERLRCKLSSLGLLTRIEGILTTRDFTFWTGTGNGYELIWTEETTWEDLVPLARL